MDVYAVLIKSGGLIWSIMGIFSTREKAEQYVNNLVGSLNEKAFYMRDHKAHQGDYEIKLFHVDEQCGVDWKNAAFAVNL